VTPSRLAVCIVTHDDADDLPGCLEAVAHLTGAGLARPVEVAVVDCDSADDSVARARAFAASVDSTGKAGEAPSALRVRVLPLGENRGFTGGMNAAIAATRSETAAEAIGDDDWVLTLNPDARPAPDYVERLIAAAQRAEENRRAEADAPSGHLELGRIGAVTGRLVRSQGDRSADGSGERVLDACGMVLTRAWRHHDRGSGEIDRSQYPRPERVFGATGAAALFRRRALEDVAFGGGEPFDPLFHTFREDAELAFRLHERGWEVLYEPGAECLHRRFNLPARRRAMPAMVNYHSLKNRYLLRAYHQTWGNALRTAPWAIGRDLAALAYVLAREHTSLAAYRWLWRHRREIRARRHYLQGRRTAPPEAVDRWFRTDALPVDPT
jgi:GT2 family glycosyltransferase